jgi:hypothetical protein
MKSEFIPITDTEEVETPAEEPEATAEEEGTEEAPQIRMSGHNKDNRGPCKRNLRKSGWRTYKRIRV